MNGNRNGKGKEYYSSGNLEYEGEYLNGKRHGQGREYFKNGKTLKYKGGYLNGIKSGLGIEYYKDGHIKYDGNIWMESQLKMNKNIIK